MVDRVSEERVTVYICDSTGCIGESRRPDDEPSIGAKLATLRRHALSSAGAELRTRLCAAVRPIALLNLRDRQQVSKYTWGGTPQYEQSTGIRKRNRLEDIEEKARSSMQRKQ